MPGQLRVDLVDDLLEAMVEHDRPTLLVLIVERQPTREEVEAARGLRTTGLWLEDRYAALVDDVVR